MYRKPFLAFLLFCSSVVSLYAGPGDDSSSGTDCECESDAYIKNQHKLEGYLDKSSYRPGETLVLFAHSLFKDLKVTLIRRDDPDVVLLVKKNVCVKKQDYSTCSYKYGCNWSPNLYLKLSENLSSGYYLLKLSSGGEAYFIPFVIKPLKQHNRLAVIATTNTWQAYNDWGGASMYSFGNSNSCNLRFAQHVSFDRPYSRLTIQNENDQHLANAELDIAKWLTQNSISFDVYSDDDFLTDSTLLKDYKVVVLAAHPEYCTKEMYDQLEKFVADGHSLFNMGGNGIYWKVTVKNRQMECRKDTLLHEQTGEKGGRWRDLGRPECELLGVQYDNRGIDTYAPYKAIDAGHWAFFGTSLSTGSIFGLQNMSNGGASGHETDKMTSLSPAGTVLLAKGQNPARSGGTDTDGGAEMTIYEHPRGGAVFCSGSIAFASGLLHDPDISIIAKNIITNMLGR